MKINIHGQVATESVNTYDTIGETPENEAPVQPQNGDVMVEDEHSEKIIHDNVNLFLKPPVQIDNVNASAIDVSFHPNNADIEQILATNDSKAILEQITINEIAVCSVEQKVEIIEILLNGGTNDREKELLMSVLYLADSDEIESVLTSLEQKQMLQDLFGTLRGNNEWGLHLYLAENITNYEHAIQFMDTLKNGLFTRHERDAIERMLACWHLRGQLPQIATHVLTDTRISQKLSYNCTSERSLTASIEASDHWLAINDISPRTGEVQTPQWFLSEEQPSQAVAVVFHGLNLKPSKMNFLSQELQGMSIDTYRATLDGHDGDSSTWKTTSREQMLATVIADLERAKQRADELGVPFILVGFSLGAALSIDAITSRIDLMPDKIILFAPAITPKTVTHAMQLFAPFPGLVIPSASPIDYQANKGTSIAAYNTLFDTVHELRDRDASVADIPTTIFIDPKDELVSDLLLEKFIAENELQNWHIEYVNNDSTTLDKPYNHLIIDDQAVGQEQWEFMVDVMRNHLFGEE